MKNENLFKKSVQILSEAYFNDTLRHGNCYACAVGNLIAANTGKVYKEYPKDRYETISSPPTFRWDGTVSWQIVSYSYIGQSDRERREFGLAEIASTGYTVNEFMQIEKAFEGANRGKSDDDWMYNGLMAVVDVLQVIHECSKEEAVVAKERFNKEVKVGVS